MRAQRRMGLHMSSSQVRKRHCGRRVRVHHTDFAARSVCHVQYWSCIPGGVGGTRLMLCCRNGRTISPTSSGWELVPYCTSFYSIMSRDNSAAVPAEERSDLHSAFFGYRGGCGAAMLDGTWWRYTACGIVLPASAAYGSAATEKPPRPVRVGAQVEGMEDGGQVFWIW